MNVAEDHAVHDGCPVAFCNPRGQVERMELARECSEKQKKRHVYIGSVIIKFVSEVELRLDVSFRCSFLPFT